MMKDPHGPVTDFADWYVDYSVSSEGCVRDRGRSPQASELVRRFEKYRSDHVSRTQNYEKYEMQADAVMVSQKPDLPNVSSGEVAGMVRRTARNVVQHAPNVEIINEFDDDGPKGILASFILRDKIIGDSLNSNEMQQNLFASVMRAFTIGFDAVTPQLVQAADSTWSMKYDTIGYRDVFPEPGVKDVRDAPEVFVRRYLTRGEVTQLIRNEVAGWDHAALRTMAQNSPPARAAESVSMRDKQHRSAPDGYEVVTWYSNTGDPFLTFDARTKMLLRIEKNKDPLKRHPVFFLVLEKDALQPLGKSQVALVFGRQEFQDLILNSAMKQWHRNLNPSIIGYGTGLNGVPNLSPGKFTNIPNPNAKIEVMEFNTQTMLQYGAISQQNLGSMVNLIGAADQQMAASAGNGMSATPQGVEAQQAMVDITTNNYQKAVEHFFSLYCSYALTVYFAELKNVDGIVPSADARRQLIGAGIEEALFDKEGKLSIDMKEMATTYSVRCVPGSLVEMEDEKQLRILNELFVPLSQAMPALANSQDPAILQNAAAAMQFIVTKEIQLSGSTHATELAEVLREGTTDRLTQATARVDELQSSTQALAGVLVEGAEGTQTQVKQLSDQVATLTQIVSTLMEKLGVGGSPQGPASPQEPPAGATSAPEENSGTL